MSPIMLRNFLLHELAHALLDQLGQVNENHNRSETFLTLEENIKRFVDSKNIGQEAA